MVYTDTTGTLPEMSLGGHQYYFIAYDYDMNCIFAIPIKDTKDDSILDAFYQVFTELKEKAPKTTFNAIDNQATTPIKEYPKKEGRRWQLLEPTNHRVNAADQAIQTFQNHFITRL